MKLDKGITKFIAVFGLVLSLLLCLLSGAWIKNVYAEEHEHKDAKSMPTEAEIIEKINIYMNCKTPVCKPQYDVIPPPVFGSYSNINNGSFPVFSLKGFLPELYSAAGMPAGIYKLKKIKCKYCNGSGDCSYCRGKGKINFRMCPDCNGDGYRPGEFKKCGTCRGKGRVGQTCPICDGSKECGWCHGAGKY